MALSSTLFLSYNTGGFPFQNNTKDLDPSCKRDLALWYCFGKEPYVLAESQTSVPGCSKQMMSLVNVLLKFQTLIFNIGQYFC